MKRCAVATAILLGIATSNVEARGPYGSINVGNWKGGAYTNDQTGAFSHCAAGTSYISGIYFVVSINDNLGWSLGFTDNNWTLTTGQAFPISLTFDGQTPFNVHGVPINDKMLVVSMPDNSSLIAQFRKAKAMTAYTQGHLFQFTRSDGAVAAKLGELRRKDETIWRSQRRRLLRGACNSSGRKTPGCGRNGSVEFS